MRAMERYGVCCYRNYHCRGMLAMMKIEVGTLTGHFIGRANVTTVGYGDCPKQQEWKGLHHLLYYLWRRLSANAVANAVIPAVDEDSAC